MKSTKKYNFLGFGNHAQDSIPAEPLPLSGFGTLGGDASALVLLRVVRKLLLNLNVVVECQALDVFTPLVDVRSVINKELPHNADSLAHSARPVNTFFHNKKMFFLLDISGKV